MKRSKNYFILIISILLFILLTTGVNNVFGSNTDWLNQHTIFPDYFRQLFYETKELIPNFAFNYGGGQNIFNISYYGFLNPLILPSYFMPFVDMTTYIIIVNIIVIIASTLLFYNFLKSHKFSDNTSLLVSLLFAFAVPIIFHMHRHIMFVNYMPFLIMAFMGVDKYIDNNKKCFLIINTFLMIMTSYYYSVGGLVTIFIYYLYRHLHKNNKFDFKEIFKFILTLIIPILMSCVLLLPTLYTLIAGRNDMHKSFSISLLLPRLKTNGLLCDVDSLGLGLIALVSLIYLFFTKKKQNIIIGSIISIIMFIPIFSYILNGGLYIKEKCFIAFIPLFCFLIAKLIEDIFENKVNIKRLSIIVLIIFAFIFLFINQDKELIQIPIILLSFILFNKYKKNVLISFPLLALAVMMSFTSAIKEETINTKEYNKIFDKEVENEIIEILNKDTDYYRFANMHYNLKTMNKIYDSRYFTTNIYSSTYNKDYLDFNRKEFLTNRDDYNYFLIPSNKDPLYNSFMGVKYIYSEEELTYPFKKISDNVYENTIALPLIYASNNIMNIEEFNTYSYPYKNYILLNSVVTNDTSNYKNIEIEKLNIDYNIVSNEGVIISDNTLKVNKKGKLVVELEKELKDKILFIEISGLKENSCKEDAITMSINNISNSLTCKKWPYPNKNNTFYYTITDNSIKTLEIELTKGTYNIDEINMYTIDNKKIVNNDITKAEIQSIFSNKITSTINVDTDGYLVTSIPYDRGFIIKIDNKIVEKEIVNTAFLGTKIQKGNHKIEIIYESPLLKVGKIISILGITVFIIIAIKEKKNKKK